MQFILFFGPLRSAEIRYSEKSENIIGLDLCILNSLLYIHLLYTIGCIGRHVTSSLNRRHKNVNNNVIVFKMNDVNAQYFKGNTDYN